MDSVEHPDVKLLLLHSWVLWLSGAALVIAAWGFVDNVNDRDGILAGAFGVMSLSLIFQII